LTARCAAIGTRSLPACWKFSAKRAVVGDVEKHSP
jgi:hypothetical protein